MKKTLWQKEKLLVLTNFFFCHYVFKKPSTAEASESVYMRTRLNKTDFHFIISFFKNWRQSPFICGKVLIKNVPAIKRFLREPDSFMTFNAFLHTPDMQQTNWNSPRQRQK